MAQPPDDRPLTPPDPPSGPPPDEQPTVAWTPPEEVPVPGDEPAAPVDVPPPDAAPIDAAPVDAAPAVPDAVPAAAATSPLISWTPSGGAPTQPGPIDAAAPAGTPVAPGVPAPAGAVVGWESPDTTLPPSPVEGYQTAGIGARIVAWIFDGVIVTLIVAVLAFVVALASGGSMADDETATLILSAVLTIGVSFLYFVGFWTGGSAATPGMRSLGLKTVAAATGQRLAIGPAILRWVAFGWPFAFVVAVPALAVVSQWALTGWTVVLLITTAISDTNQGIHDRVAGSAVIRRIGAGSGCAVVGCIVLIALAGLLVIVLPILALAALGPEFWDEFMRQMELEMERAS